MNTTSNYGFQKPATGQNETGNDLINAVSHNADLCDSNFATMAGDVNSKIDGLSKDVTDITNNDCNFKGYLSCNSFGVASSAYIGGTLLLGGSVLNSSAGQSLQINRTGGNGTVIICDGTGTGGGGQLNCGQIYANNSITCGGSLLIKGAKTRVVQTEDYGERCLNAFETPSCLFSDFGRGQLINGECKIDIDRIFLETINTDIDYDVFLTKYGKGDIYVDFDSMTSNSFVVKGDNDIKFSYQIVAKQKDYETKRLQRVGDK